MRFYMVSLLTLSCILPAQVPLDETDKTGSIEILVVDSMGRPVHGKIAIFAQRVPSDLHSRPSPIGRTANLKYGTYKISVMASPAYTVVRDIVVRARQQVIIVGLFIAPIESPWLGNYVHGKVPASSANNRCRWVRLMSLVEAGEYHEVKTLESGEFAIENIKPGRYALVTIGDEGICGVSQTTVFDKRTQELVIH